MLILKNTLTVSAPTVNKSFKGKSLTMKKKSTANFVAKSIVWNAKSHIPTTTVKIGKIDRQIKTSISMLWEIWESRSVPNVPMASRKTKGVITYHANAELIYAGHVWLVLKHLGSAIIIWEAVGEEIKIFIIEILVFKVYWTSIHDECCIVSIKIVNFTTLIQYEAQLKINLGCT